MSRLTEVLWEDQGRDLSGLDVVHLFCDAAYGSLRAQAGLKEGVLVSWAILPCGAEVLLSMSLGNEGPCGGWLHISGTWPPGVLSPPTMTGDGAFGLNDAA